MSYSGFINKLARSTDALHGAGWSDWSPRLLVRHIDGSYQEAILMAVFGRQLRVSIPAAEDAIEISWAGSYWQAEDGEPVDIEFDAVPQMSDSWFDCGLVSTSCVN